MSDNTCFNCQHSKQGTEQLDKVIFQVAPCQNSEVDEQLLACLDEYALPDYCEHYELKQASDT